MKAPLFSIIVPVYNVQAYLAKCTESILNQTFRDFEVILINDGSTDNSGIICDEYAQKDSRIVVIHKENEGVGEARNVGLRIVKGDYIIFVDSDDCIDENTCEIMRQIINDHPSIDIIAANYKEIHKNKTKINPYTFVDKSSNKTLLTGIDFIKAQIKHTRRYHGVIWTCIYSRRFLMDNQLFFEKTILEDVEWIPRVYLLARSVFITNYYFYNYIRRDNSLSNPIQIEKYHKNIVKALQLTYQSFSLVNKTSDDELKNMYYEWSVRRLLHYMLKIPIYRKKYRYLAHQELIENKPILSNKTRLRVKIYLINPYLYYFLFTVIDPVYAFYINCFKKVRIMRNN